MCNVCWERMVASRKVIQKDADKQSAIVQQFAESLAAGSSSSAAPPAATVISSSGFVPRSEETEKAKEEQRSWDRAALLKVDDEDAQVKIYNAYSQNANTKIVMYAFNIPEWSVCIV